MNEVRGGILKFHEYEVDRGAGELRKNGKRLALQEQPFQILVALVERPGEIVTREDLRGRLWPGQPFVDFDQGLNTAINKLRESLGDSAANPRFVETVPRRGYRFISSIEVGADPGPDCEPSAKAAVVPRRHTLLIAAVAVGFAGIGMWLWVRQRPPLVDSNLALRRFALSTPLTTVSTTGCNRSTAISPDGKKIAFTQGVEPNLRLWIQHLDQEQPTPVEGGEGAQCPFWSPDSKTVGFAVKSRRAVMRINADGGVPSRICDMKAGFFSGAAWSPDGSTIVFTLFGAGEMSVMYEVPASGGNPKAVISRDFLNQIRGAPEGSLQYLHNPHFLPAERGRRVIVFGAGWNDAHLLLADLDNGRTEILGPGRLSSYSPASGHLISQSADGTQGLWAQPFSLDALKITGPAFSISRNGTEPSVAVDGTLVYLDPASHHLVWVGRRGEKIGEAVPPKSGFFYPAISPDGRKVAAEVRETGNLDVWVHDFASGTRTRLSINPSIEILPVWSPDGERVAYSSWRAGNTDIFLRRADASAEEATLAATPARERVSDWSRDGKHILYSREDANGQSELRYLRRKDAGTWEQVPFLQTRFRARAPKFSPDGHYVAYLSDESGRDELYVRPFPRGERQWAVSRNGARQPRWARNGRELFYVESGTLMSVPVRTVPSFSAGVPFPLFAHPGFASWVEANYDVAPDGERFLIPELAGGQNNPRLIHVVQNWFAEFRDRR